MDALGTHLLQCSHGDERTAAHDAVRDAFYYIVRTLKIESVIALEQAHSHT